MRPEHEIQGDESMLFYSLEYRMEQTLEFEECRGRDKMLAMQELGEDALQANQSLWKESGIAFYISNAKNRQLTLCAVTKHGGTKSGMLLGNLLETYLGKLMIRGKLADCREITLREFESLLNQGNRKSFIEDADEQMKVLGITSIRHNEYKEAEGLIENSYDRRKAEQTAKSSLCAESFLPEIDRICAPEAPKAFAGHPVHYILSAHSGAVMEKMRWLLLGTLYGSNRLLSKRVCVIDLLKDNGRLDYNDIEEMLSTMDGGTVVYKLSGFDCDSEYADTRQEAIDWMVRRIKSNRRNVLSLIELDSKSEKVAAPLCEQLYGLTMIHLQEEIVFRDAAKEYLRRLAKTHEVHGCKALYAQLGEDEKGYTATDLDRLFDKWYDDYLRTHVYAQYAPLFKDTPQVRAKPKGDAFAELNAMIGLTETKRMILEAIDFHKAQKLFADKGFCAKRPAMHMVFYGNPGTAKTTVARLVAQIMKDNGLLSEGRLIEVGRSDLVGKYVGWTAPAVKDCFRRAKGSVLFIDEAYSLVDGRDGMYGDEAINTIVQEMENAREDTVVIFAGYPDKMQGFIEKNPGLKSRIAFHVDFPDYSAGELMEIMRLMIKNKNLRLGDGAEKKIYAILSAAMGESDFGNGRFVRNVLEKAILRQAARLMRGNPNDVAEQDIQTLLAEDFMAPQQGKKIEKRAIGF